MLEPANGYFGCCSSIRRINATSADDTGVGCVAGGRARELQELALPHNQEGAGSGDYRVALSKSALVSALSYSSTNCPILSCRTLRSGTPTWTSCRQLRQRLVALEGVKDHLSLECRTVIAFRSFHRLAPLVRHPSRASVKQGYHLSYYPNFQGPLLPGSLIFSWHLQRANQSPLLPAPLIPASLIHF